MILSNGKFVFADGTVKICDVEIAGGKISRIADKISGRERINLSGKTVFPGFIDIHTHGAFGVRVTDENTDLTKYRRMEATKGVTGLAITTIGTEWEELLPQYSLIAENAKIHEGARVLGIHSEPPFVSRRAMGAAVPSSILSPDIYKFDEMYEASLGLLKIITIAPEEDGAIELIRHAVARGVVVSLGHTDATYDEAMRGIEAGATHATHTFNAMRKLHHREPGVLGAVLTDPRVKCEAICDHVHLHPTTIKLIYKLKGADAMIAVSDSVNVAGTDVTEFYAEGQRCTVKDGVIRLDNGTINGSAMTLLEGVQNLIRADIPLSDVSKITSLNAAKSLGVSDLFGSIEVGKAADFAILDEDLSLYETYIDGKCVFERGEEK